MAKTKLISITVDNKPGAVASIAKTLGDAKVNILSLLATSHGPAGTVQFVTANPAQARKTLDSARISYQEIPAEEHELANKPGALAACLAKLAAKGTNLSAICATTSKGGKKATLVYAAETAEKAVAAATGR
jgi:hypothetical protein